MEKYNSANQNVISGQAVLQEWLRSKWGLDSTESFQQAWLKVSRQGYGQCMINQSMNSGPLVIGTTKFARGLGVHACSEIQVVLPSAGKVLHATIGRDQNSITTGESANIHFRVDGNGRELYESPLIKGGEEPLEIEVDLEGANEITLRVGDAFDWGHADWAEARVMLQNGQTVWLDELPFEGLAPICDDVPPFSFRYDGAAFASQLPSWRRSIQTEALDEHRSRHVITYNDQSSGLEARCEITVFHDFSAVEWVIHFTNTGEVPLAAVDEMRSLDMQMSRSVSAKECVLHYAVGSVCAERDFQPLKQILLPESDFRLSPEQGRSSSGTMPYFNLESSGGGVIIGIGWTGQWRADFQRDRETSVRVQTGLEKASIELLPGETVRTPSTLLFFWKGDSVRAHNLWRQFILRHYSPRPSGLPVKMPISFATWGMLEEKEMLRRNELVTSSGAGFDTFWVDAGWYGECKRIEDWYQQAGNWQQNSELFPRGLKSVADEVHRSGRRFLLWFDCERVYRGSEMHRKHPEWLLELEPEKQTGYPGMNENFLLNLGCPEARRFVTEMISKVISEVGIDIVRQDFNVEPLPFWRKYDPPNRKGITEIRYIEGLYAFWDELLARHPHILIDNCASGGRRLDFEMARRSVPLWRSDLQCCPDYSALGTQSQTFGLASWLPLSSAGTREYDDTYDFRSGLGSGTVTFWSPKLLADNPKWAKERLEEAYMVRPYFQGDFYPLTSYSLSSDVWLAFQLDRPDLGNGIVLVFRRENAPYSHAELRLQGLDVQAQYSIRNLDTDISDTYSGSLLVERGVTLRLKNMRTSAILHYCRT